MSRDFPTADALRDSLRSMGVEVFDQARAEPHTQERARAHTLVPRNVLATDTYQVPLRRAGSSPRRGERPANRPLPFI
eukprot:2722634-Pleurochrysis_carterae.AAC.1